MGALLLAVLYAIHMIVAGQPWGIVYGIGLWGAKVFSALGWSPVGDAFWGVAWLQDLHEGLGESLMPMVGLHAVAALVMGRIERTRLVKAMVTGVKERY